MSAYRHHHATYRPWYPRAGSRVIVRGTLGIGYGGEHGTIEEWRRGRGVIVKLDAHEIPRVFQPRELEPEA